MIRTKFTSLDMIRFVKFANENTELKPLEQLKKYSEKYPEISEAEKMANLKKWLGKDLCESLKRKIESKKAAKRIEIEEALIKFIKHYDEFRFQVYSKIEWTPERIAETAYKTYFKDIIQ